MFAAILYVIFGFNTVYDLEPTVEAPPLQFGILLEGGLGIGSTGTKAGSFFDIPIHASMHIKWWEEYSIGFGISGIFGSGTEWVSDDPNTPDIDETIEDSMASFAYYIQNRFYLSASNSFFLFLNGNVGVYQYSGELFYDDNTFSTYKGRKLFAGLGVGFRTYVMMNVYLFLNGNYNYYFLYLNNSDFGNIDPSGSLDISVGMGVVF